MTAVKMDPNTPTLQKAYLDNDLPESYEVNGRYSEAGHAVNKYIDQTAVTIMQSVLIGAKLGNIRNLTNLEALNMKLGSEEMLSAVLEGNGTPIAGLGAKEALRDASRLAAQFGGDAEDWAKLSTPTRTIRGIKYSIHWYNNKKLGLTIEAKTVIGR